MNDETKAKLRVEFDGPLDTDLQEWVHDAVKKITEHGNFVTARIVARHINVKPVTANRVLYYWRGIEAPDDIEYFLDRREGTKPRYLFFYQAKTNPHRASVRPGEPVEQKTGRQRAEVALEKMRSPQRSR